MAKVKYIINTITIVMIMGLTITTARATIVDNADRFAEKAGGASFELTESPSPAIIIANIIKWALTVLGIVFAALTVYSGYLWLTAGGNEEQVGIAKKRIINAIIGLALTLTAYAFTYMILEGLIEVVQGRF